MISSHVAELTIAGYELVPLRVDTRKLLTRHYAGLDIMLSDYSLPNFSVWRHWIAYWEPNRICHLSSCLVGIGEESPSVPWKRCPWLHYEIKLKTLGAAIERELADAFTRREKKKGEEIIIRKEQELRHHPPRLVTIQEEEAGCRPRTSRWTGQLLALLKDTYIGC